VFLVNRERKDGSFSHEVCVSYKSKSRDLLGGVKILGVGLGMDFRQDGVSELRLSRKDIGQLRTGVCLQPKKHTLLMSEELI